MSKNEDRSRKIYVLGVADNRLFQYKGHGKPEPLVGVCGVTNGDYESIWMSPKKARKIAKKILKAADEVENNRDCDL